MILSLLQHRYVQDVRATLGRVETGSLERNLQEQILSSQHRGKKRKRRRKKKRKRKKKKKERRKKKKKKKRDGKRDRERGRERERGNKRIERDVLYQ